MDATKNKKLLDLGQSLRLYSVLWLIFFGFIILSVILLITNIKGFNKSFGYQIFITVPFITLITILINELVFFKNNPDDSFFRKFNISYKSWFLPFMSFITLCIAILGFFMMLYVGGIFSNSPPENNTAMLLNVFIFLAFIIFSLFYYNIIKGKDDNSLKTLPKQTQMALNMRSKYTIIFMFFVILMGLLFLVNPWNIITDYSGPVMFFTLFVGILLVVMIYIYQNVLSDPLKIHETSNTSILTIIGKSFYILFALGASFGLIYALLNLLGIFNQDFSDPKSWGNAIFNIVLFCAMLGMIYKLANAGGFLDKNPYYRLILNILFYIPCLLVIAVDKIYQLFGLKKPSTGSTITAFSPPTPFEINMLIISIALLTLYFLWFFIIKKKIQNVYFKRGGKQLINQPLQTDILTNVISYQSLTNSETFDYQYAMSFWVYLDSFPPSTNSSYSKLISLLSYGQNPSVKYSSSNNTLYITVKQTNTESGNEIAKEKEKEKEINAETIDKWNNEKTNINNNIENVKDMIFSNEVDTDGHRIIYSHSDVHLQKWNHIVLNYSGGTLDVFYNGELVKSAIGVVPYLNFDMLTVGTENGVSGNIANLLYFDHPIDILTMNSLYRSFTHKNPPVIPEDNNVLIPV
jgi:hypothetical protein